MGNEALWRAQRELEALLPDGAQPLSGAERETAIDSCLDIVVEALGANRGMLLGGCADGSMQVLYGRGERRALTVRERVELSTTLIQRVRDDNSCLAWDISEQGLTRSVSMLGITWVLAAPLHHPDDSGQIDARSAERIRGVLYVDSREVPSQRPARGGLRQKFLVAAAQTISAILAQERPVVSAEAFASRATRTMASSAVQLRRDIDFARELEELLRPRSMKRIRSEVMACLHGRSSLLITGESGTGKTRLARAIAEASGRQPVVRATLGCSDDLNTITSELFGHERGAFSGATGRRVGLVAHADGGTLILDEILNLPPHAQQLLLDFTQFGSYRPLGHEACTPRRANVRIIAVTNGDLRAAVREGRFRRDLYYRLAGVALSLPALRERREDIPGLVEGILRRIDPERSWALSMRLRWQLSSNALAWPGNVRQLENLVGRARDRAAAEPGHDGLLDVQHFESDERVPLSGSMPHSVTPASIGAPQPAPRSTKQQPEDLAASWRTLQVERDTLAEREKRLIQSALERNGWVIARVARAFGIARTTLASRISALGLKRVPYRDKRARSSERPAERKLAMPGDQH